jgi:hypothetical protein
MELPSRVGTLGGWLYIKILHSAARIAYVRRIYQGGTFWWCDAMGAGLAQMHLLLQYTFALLNNK